MPSRSFVASTRAPRKRSEPQRLLTLEEFTQQPRTEEEIATYHAILGGLQRIGALDDDLNVVRP